jgi:hypothetical protein
MLTILEWKPLDKGDDRLRVHHSRMGTTRNESGDARAPTGVMVG